MGMGTLATEELPENTQIPLQGTRAPIPRL